MHREAETKCQPMKYVLFGFAKRTGLFGSIGRSCKLCSVGELNELLDSKSMEIRWNIYMNVESCRVGSDSIFDHIRDI